MKYLCYDNKSCDGPADQWLFDENMVAMSLGQEAMFQNEIKWNNLRA